MILSSISLSFVLHLEMQLSISLSNASFDPVVLRLYVVGMEPCHCIPPACCVIDRRCASVAQVLDCFARGLPPIEHQERLLLDELLDSCSHRLEATWSIYRGALWTRKDSEGHAFSAIFVRVSGATFTHGDGHPQPCACTPFVSICAGNSLVILARWPLHSWSLRESTFR